MEVNDVAQAITQLQAQGQEPSIGNIRRKVATTGELVARKHEATTLEGDMPHRRQPRLAAIRRRRTVDLNALGEHRHAQ